MTKRLAFLGPAGTFSEQAALLCDPQAQLLPFSTVAAVAAAVGSGMADEGVMAIENSLEGSVTDTLDVLDPRIDAADTARAGAADRALSAGQAGHSGRPGRDHLLASAGAGAVPPLPGALLPEGAAGGLAFDDGCRRADDAAGRSGGGRDRCGRRSCTGWRCWREASRTTRTTRRDSCSSRPRTARRPAATRRRSRSRWPRTGREAWSTR